MKRLLLTLAVVCIAVAWSYADEPSSYTPTQCAQAVKLLKSHNVMIDFCGCCEVRKKPVYVQIKSVVTDSTTIIVKGTDIESGKSYDEFVDLNAVWLPFVLNGELKKIECACVKMGWKCNPCTSLATPTGDIGQKVLDIEKEGLMDPIERSNGGKNQISVREESFPGGPLEKGRGKAGENRNLKPGQQPIKKVQLDKPQEDFPRGPVRPVRPMSDEQ